MQVSVDCSLINDIVWKNGAECIYAVGPAVDIWYIRISAWLDYKNSYWVSLSADEQERAGRYYQEKDRDRFIVSRGVLRNLLSRYLHITAAELEFEAGDNKKPGVKNTGTVKLHYNISHSGDCILIAVSSLPVGVDVEKTDTLFPYTEVLDYSFSLPEEEYIRQSDLPVKAFYTLWTRKEALLKSTGKGIDDDMKLIPCLDGAQLTDEALIGSNSNWCVTTFDVAESYICSIATPPGSINFFSFS